MTTPEKLATLITEYDNKLWLKSDALFVSQYTVSTEDGTKIIKAYIDGSYYTGRGKTFVEAFDDLRADINNVFRNEFFEVARAYNIFIDNYIKERFER